MNDKQKTLTNRVEELETRVKQLECKHNKVIRTDINYICKDCGKVITIL